MRITRYQIAAAVSSALAVSALSCLPAHAAPPAPAPRDAPAAAITVKDVALTVGTNAHQRRVTWLTTASTTTYVQLATVSRGRQRDRGWAGARTILPNVGGAAGEQPGWSYNQAVLSALASNTSYRYRICQLNGPCGDELRFSTTGSGSFNFMVYGDPQVYLGSKTGQGGVVENPAAGWATTLDASTKRFAHTAFLLTAGDQVDSYTVASQVGEWDAFLAPKQVTSYPLAPNLGNHDNASGAGYLYAQHFALPNLNTAIGGTAAGTGDYWYRYNNVLFLSINSNNLDFAAHKVFLANAIAANRGATWRIVTFHHSPFSSADHPSDADVVSIRTSLTPIISALKINLVIGGHDHDYTRSYLMDGATVASKNAGGVLHPKKGQVLYLATNSASGGKFYDLTGPYPWAAVTNQSLKANYTNIAVTGTDLTATTYEVGGGIVDRVVLTRAR